MNSEVSVRSLRRRLAEQIKSEDMERSEQQDTPQASAPADLLRSGMVSITPDTGELSQRGSERGQVSVWFWWSYYDKWRPGPSRSPRKYSEYLFVCGRFTPWDLPMIESLSRACYFSSQVVY